MLKIKKKKANYRLVWINWDKILVLNLLVPICLLVCPWKLKVAALAQGCLVLLLLLLLHCNCSACAQLTPKHARPLPNKYATLWYIKPHIALFWLDFYLRTIVPNHLVCYKFQFGWNLLLGHNYPNVCPTPWWIDPTYNLSILMLRTLYLILC